MRDRSKHAIKPESACGAGRAPRYTAPNSEGTMSLRAILRITAGAAHETCVCVATPSDPHSPPVFAVP